MTILVRRARPRLAGALLAAACLVTGACSPGPAPSTASPAGTLDPGTPAPTASTAPVATPAPTATPGASLPPDPTPSPTPTPAAFVPPVLVAGTLPVHGDAAQGPEVLVTPGLDGRDAWVVVNHWLTPQNLWRTEITHLDATGHSSAGWPVAIDGWNCGSRTGSNQRAGVLAANDGSIRLLCAGQATDAEGDPTLMAGVAIGADGTMLPGWPVDLRTGGWDSQAVVIGDLLVVGNAVVTSPENDPLTLDYHVTTVDGHGSVQRGETVSMPGWAWYSLGADGVMRVMAADQRTVTAIGPAGIVDGWPITFNRRVSAPAVLADGTSVWVQGKPGYSRTVVVDSFGEIQPTGSAWLPVTQYAEWSGAGPAGGPAVPAVAPDGTTYLIGQRKTELLVYGLDAQGEVLPGFPVTTPWRLEAQGRCTPADSGCGVWTVRPATGASGTIYLPIRPLDRQTGGWVTALTLDGTVRDGWSLVLGGRGDTFWALAASPKTVFGMHVNRSSLPTVQQVWSIAPSSAVRWKVTVVQP